MSKPINNILAPSAAAASLLMLGACGSDEEEENVDFNNLLIGQWELESIDGEDFATQEDGYLYSLSVEFEADGDFQLCSGVEEIANPINSYNECYDGDWSWVNVGSELEFSYVDDFQDEYNINFDIMTITENRLEGTWQEQGFPTVYELVFEKN